MTHNTNLLSISLFFYLSIIINSISSSSTNDDKSPTNYYQLNKTEIRQCYENYESPEIYNDKHFVCIHGLGIFDTAWNKGDEVHQIALDMHPVEDILRMVKIYFLNPESIVGPDNDRNKVCSPENLTKTWNRDNIYNFCTENIKDELVTPFKLRAGNLNMKPDLLTIQNMPKLIENGFSFNRKTIIITHGFSTETEYFDEDPDDTHEPKRMVWETLYEKSFCKGLDTKVETMMRLMNLLTCYPTSYNIIVVNWVPSSLLPYWHAARNAKGVGRMVGNLVYNLYKKSGNVYGPQNFHLIGFSLGAQVMGFAGQHFQFLTNKYEKPASAPIKNQKIARITGLDPASFAFDDDIDFLPNASKLEKEMAIYHYIKTQRLSKDDADLVIVYHTDTWAPLGIYGAGNFANLGHFDLWVNNGTKQARCVTDKSADLGLIKSLIYFADVAIHSLIQTVCDHTTAAFMFASIVERDVLQQSPYTAYNFNEFIDFKTQNYDPNFCHDSENNTNRCLPLSLNFPKIDQNHPNGNYYFETKALQRDSNGLLLEGMNPTRRSVAEFCVDHLIFKMRLTVRHLNKIKEDERIDYTLKIIFQNPDPTILDYHIENLQIHQPDFNFIQFSDVSGKRKDQVSKNIRTQYAILQTVVTLPCSWRDQSPVKNKIPQNINLKIDFQNFCQAGVLCEKYPKIHDVELQTLPRYDHSGRLDEMLPMQNFSFCARKWRKSKSKDVVYCPGILLANKRELSLSYRKDEFCQKICSKCQNCQTN